MQILSRIIAIVKEEKIKCIFIFLIAVYAASILINPNLAPTDDFIFLRTLQAGKPLLYYSQNFPYYNAAEMGRFTPLAAMEYNFFGIFSKSPNPFWYFFYHTLQFIIISFLLVKIISQFTSNKLFIYGAPILLFLTPGFTISWFRMQMNERNIIFFLAIFLFFYLAYLKNQKIIYLALGLIFANFAIYYKETAFIAIGVFAFFHFLLSIKTADLKTKIFDSLLLLSSAAYLSVYYFYIYINRGPALYGRAEFNWFLVFAKNILNYGFFSDPLLILLLMPLFFWRLFKIFFKHQKPHPLFDSLLASASIYISSFFILNMYGPYYLLPAYLLALPPLIYFFSQRQPKIIFWKIFGGIAAFFFIVNTLPSGIHYLTYYKYLPINFNKTLDFLIQDINSKHPLKQTNIFMDGVGRGTGRGTYFVLAEFLKYKGLSDKQFDLKSNIETEITSPLISKISAPFTVFQKDAPDIIKSGDYLIVSPQSAKINPSQNYLQSLEKDYDLAFQADSPFSFPDINLKTLTKYLLSKKISKSQKSESIMINKNLMNQPDYYIFIKK